MDQGSDQDLPRKCGRYVLTERLGGGGMAEVYKARLARSEGPDRTLVVKLLPRDADPLAAARFIDEAKIALPLTHGNITATFEFGKHDGRPFLVMEYVHGRSLRQIIDELARRGESMPVPIAVFIAREVARALRYGHHFIDDSGRETPIVHRDVSPENVLVSFSGQVKLTDFGIARSVHALDMAGAWGKPAYVAPEILEGDPGGPASDVYGLACVLYELLSGWPPLIGKSDEETLAKVRAEAPVPVGRLRDGIADGLEHLLLEALAKDPKARRIDASQLEVTLSQLLSAEAPHLTEADLAAMLARLFERTSENDAARRDSLLATRLRDQLAEAGVETTGRESAAEMLALGTVQLSPEPPLFDGDASPKGSADSTLQIERGVVDRQGAEQRRRLPLVAALLVVAMLTAGALIVAGREIFQPDDGAPNDPGDDDAATAVASRLTDAAPPTPDSGAAAAPDASGSTAHDTDGGDGGLGDGAPPPRRDDRPRPRRRRPAVVSFNSIPWSFVYVDGTKLQGHTPVRKVRLSPGRHRVRFHNPELGLSRTTTVRLLPGEQRLVKARLARPQSE